MKEVLKEDGMDSDLDDTWKGNITKRQKMKTCIKNLLKINK